MRQLIQISVNDRERELAVKPNSTLLEVLRDDLDLRGAVEGCGVGVCGSCTVLVDGQPVSSCLMLATNAEGRRVETIEGLAHDGQLDPVQQAFLDQSAFQCGFCTTGMIMAVKGLLAAHDDPSEAEIRDYLGGNLCRCGTYSAVIAAVQGIIAQVRSSAGAAKAPAASA